MKDYLIIIDPGKGWGNFVSKLNAFSELSQRLESKIIIFTKKSTQAESYLKYANFVQKVIYLEDFGRGLKYLKNNFFNFIKDYKKLKKYSKYNCYIFHTSLRYLIYAKLVRFNKIFSLGYRFQNFFLSKNFKLYKNFWSRDYPWDKEASEFVKKITNNQSIKFKPFILKKNKKKNLISICIAASGPSRRWGIKNFIKVIEYFIKKNNKSFLIISGKDQSDDEKNIKNYFKKNNKCRFVFSSQKKIAEVIPYLLRSKVYVGNDTGFSHLSVNFGILSFVISGDFAVQKYSRFMVGVESQKSKKIRNIKNISLRKVINKIERVYFNRRGGRVV
jgi:heptosyltransferase-2